IANGPGSDVVKQSVIGRALGEIAKAVDTTDRAFARKTLDRVLQRLDDIRLADHKSSSLIDMASALAKTGDFERAMREARLIGEGPSHAEYDMRDGKPYAMLLIAIQQREARDRDGARTTLREAYETAKPLTESRGKSGRLQQVAAGMISIGDLAG